MPFSNPSLRKVVREWLEPRFDSNTLIVDIGAGAGAYYDLLGDRYRLIAVEAYEPYVRNYKLRSKYVGVYVQNALDVDDYIYEGKVVILGDVLEHFTPADARKLLDKLKAAKPKAIVVIVPYLYEQGPDHPDVIKFGNPLEVHHQPDLTAEVVTERYPELKVIARNDQIGAYYWVPSE